MGLAPGVSPFTSCAPTLRGPFAFPREGKEFFLPLEREERAIPSLGHLPQGTAMPTRRSPSKGAPESLPLRVRADPLSPAPLPWMSLSILRQEQRAVGLAGKDDALTPQKPPKAGREQAGDSVLPQGPCKGLIYCCILKDAIKTASGAGSTAARADQRLINVGQLVILSDNYPQTV